MSNSSIVSIREIIDTAFGESDKNIVNFKLIQTILYILAKELRLLHRRVEVDIARDVMPLKSSLSITEVRLKTVVPKKNKNVEEKRFPSTFKIKSGSLTEPSSSKSTTERSSDKTTSKSTSERSSDKTTSKSTTERSSEKTTSKSTTEQSSSLKTTSQSSSDRTKSWSSKTKSSSTKSSSGPTEDYRKMDYHRLLENIEQQRERELRIVNQRADSREEAEKTPTPMASLDSMEMQYEKLLVVERVPKERVETKTGQSRFTKEMQLSVVTQDQFDRLARIVKELQEKFSPIGIPGFPDNMQLMQDLRKGASLTDAMAALQLSARLESAEKTLEKLMSLMTDFAIRKGVDITVTVEKEPPETKVIFDAPDHSLDISQPSRKSISRKQSSKSTKKLIGLNEETEKSKIIYAQSTDVAEDHEDEDLTKLKPDCITIAEFDDAMEQAYDSIVKFVTNITGKASSNAEEALTLAHKIEGKLNSALAIDNRMSDLELLVAQYAEQINILDTGLSSQMTNYQEQLTQMQHDLEAGLEAMGEAMANTGGDTAAVTELNANFTNLQVDLDVTNMKQKDLRDNQNLLSIEVQALWKDIEILRGDKSDRDEVADALRDKAGLGALNGLVTHQQFNAVRGDFEKRIGASYDKFNSQEIIWQKAIDDLLRELNEKADKIQVISLRDDVNNNLENLRYRIKAMMEIVGEPRAAALAKKLFRDTACLSCSSPANMQLEEPGIPALPVFPNSSTRPPTIGAEDTKPKEDGDHGICYPGRPIPHPRDPRSHICKRYCGGSHTKVLTNVIQRAAPPEISITVPQREIITEVGTDGKIYKTEEIQKLQIPCVPCNRPNVTIPQPSELRHDTDKYTGQYQHWFDSNETALDFMPYMVIDPSGDNVSVTPPPPVDD